MPTQKQRNEKERNSFGWLGKIIEKRSTVMLIGDQGKKENSTSDFF